MLSRALAIFAVFIVACSGQKPRLLHPTDPSTDFYTVSPGINHWLGYLDRYFLWKASRYHAKMPGWSLAARAS